MRVTKDDLARWGYKEQKDGTWSRDYGSKASRLPPGGKVNIPGSDSSKVSELESDNSSRSEATKNPKRKNARDSGYSDKRYDIFVTAYNRRFMDPDNLCPKWFIDGLVRAKIIPSDSNRFVRWVIKEVVKIDYSEAERTEIRVYECSNQGSD